ncbi:nuclear transport factor 2 family protein [Rhizobium laguerreae]|uniref:nuclear transport factor 2 family protein n=1 Tax=Rhizobium laguerreae TaxID=1076926 RepID=UPI0024847B3E|nr:nuclear transport factor 2 family protein [Rhizobium laguerreae]
MKTLMLTAAAGVLLASFTASAESIDADDRAAIIDTITDIAAGADRHQWDRVRGAFADTVTLDYTGLWGGEPTTRPKPSSGNGLPFCRASIARCISSATTPSSKVPARQRWPRPISRQSIGSARRAGY